MILPMVFKSDLEKQELYKIILVFTLIMWYNYIGRRQRMVKLSKLNKELYKTGEVAKFLITTLCLDIVKNQWTIKTLNLTEPIERYIPKYYINKK
jgi:hypothetical protein